jgi:hypothetical protein
MQLFGRVEFSSTIFYLDNSWRRVVSFTLLLRRVVSFTLLLLYLPGKEPLVHIGEEAGWASEPVWTL